MKILIILTILALVFSTIVDRSKTWKAVKKGFFMFINMLLPFLSVLILVSFFLALISKETIVYWLGGSSGIWAYISSALLGSISLIPGFIAYPLAGILLKMGVSYPVLAIFITTLMMVGILTLPLEAKYFGWKVAIVRNLFSFVGAIFIGIAVGVFI